MYVGTEMWLKKVNIHISGILWAIVVIEFGGYFVVILTSSFMESFFIKKLLLPTVNVVGVFFE